MNKEQFLIETKKLGINISVDTLSKLEEYYNLLVEENNKYNLTAITEESQVYLKHFYDSLCIIKIIDLNNQYLLDIGTGAGFPGLVLKIVFPNLKIDLLDSTNKKCMFLKMVIDKLNLKDINVINARAEEYSKENREKYDIVTSRAVANLRVLAELCIPFVKKGGIFIAMKGRFEDEESSSAASACKKLGSEAPNANNTHRFALRINSTNNDERAIIVLKKVAPTDVKYPRNYSQIKKKSL